MTPTREMMKKFFIVYIIVYWVGMSISFGAEVAVKEWSELTDQDISPQGKRALAAGDKAWLHAETEHFVYHFTDEKKAGAVTSVAETYYQWIKDLFGVQKDGWKKKAHVFIFEDKEVWTDFNQKAGEKLEFNAFTTGWELFIYLDPYWLRPKKTLAHELTHVILFRFLEGPIPLSLNEGFAEFVGFRAISTQFDGDEYRIHTVQKLLPEQWIEPAELITARNYPASQEKTEVFYRESELFTRFLILNFEPALFYKLLHETSSGKDLKQALADMYSQDWEMLKERFEAFAIEK